MNRPGLDLRVKRDLDGNPAKPSPLAVRCKACGCVWAAAWAPMAMALFAEVARGAKHCPWCGAGSKSLVMASKKDAERLSPPIFTCEEPTDG